MADKGEIMAKLDLDVLESGLLAGIKATMKPLLDAAQDTLDEHLPERKDLNLEWASIKDSIANATSTDIFTLQMERAKLFVELVERQIK